MKSRKRDIVDRLNDLKVALTEQENPKNKKQADIQFYRQPKNNSKPQHMKSKNTVKTRKKQKDEENDNRNYDDKYSNSDENEIANLNTEEEEEESDPIISFSFDNRNHTEYDENTEYIFSKDDYEEEEEEKEEHPSPIRNFARLSIRSDARSFVKFTYFRRWRRAFHAKQIQKSIDNKMKKYKKSEKEKDNGIYTPCYDTFTFKKATRSEQSDAVYRLSMPKGNNSPRKLNHENPQYKPKNEDERKQGQRRHIVRQIAFERDEKEHSSKPKSQKEIMKTVDRLLLPKRPQEKEPERPKPSISQRQQLEISLRLSVPKKEVEKEETIQKKTNKFILPTKKEQLEICDRLAQPKPDYSPKPIKHKATITPAEQMEICERLSGLKKSKVVKRKYDDNKVKKDDQINKKKVHKKTKKKGKKNRKKKIKSDQNDESLTFLSNNAVVLPSSSPVPTQNMPASPLIINTPRRVRFNTPHSASRKNQNQASGILLSRAVNEAIGETSENDSHSSLQRTPQEFSTLISDDESIQNQNSPIISPREQNQQPEREELPRMPSRSGRRASYTPTRFNQIQRNVHNTSNDDNDLNRRNSRHDTYRNIAGYRRNRLQNNTHFPSSDDGSRHSPEEAKYPTSEDDQIQFKNEIEQKTTTTINQTESIEIHHIQNQSEIVETVFSSSKNELEIQNEEEEKHEFFEPKEDEKDNNEQIINDNDFNHSQITEEEDDENNKEVKIQIFLEEEENEINEEEEDLQSPSNSLLKSSENENENDEDDDEFKFESQPDGFYQEEEDDDNNNDMIQDQLFSEEESPHPGSLRSHGGLSSEIETETIKEINETDLNQFVKENLFTIEEEEDENDETVINENISGIEAHTPINGLISNSEIDINLFSNTQDSNNSD